MPGARCKHAETRSLEFPEIPSSAADQERVSLPLFLGRFRRGKMESDLRKIAEAAKTEFLFPR